MRTHLIAAACSLVLLNLVLIAPAAAQSRMKGCADEWKAMKAASQTAGKTYRAFQKECMGRQSAAAATASPGQPAVAGAGRSAKRARTAKSGKAGGGRQAMLARQRACAAEWKATKAQAAAGMTWPKFWSACNKRKQAEGT